jgi:hypothetical protein
MKKHLHNSEVKRAIYIFSIAWGAILVLINIIAS